ncbi:MAG: hypothetical protein HPY65_08290 [Syntrophaceae bacterium]|nr:hypothetical protein [Syntrophaceae bacterium]
MKESSFVREVEDRLDALFGIDEDSTGRSGKVGPDHSNARDMLESIAAEPAEPAGRDADATVDPDVGDPLNGKDESESPVRDGRYHILLEENEQESATESPVADHPSLDEIASVAEPDAGDREGAERFERIFGDIASYTPALFSPIKNLKSILLSLEWEINDTILNRLDAELSGLQDLYRHERTVLGFLRILRFLERYIRVKQGDSHTESIRLLFSVYDDLERIILSKTVSEDMKRAILVADIGKYRDWVENIDLSAPPEADAGENVTPVAAEPGSPAPEFLPEVPAVEAPVEQPVEAFEHPAPDPCAAMQNMEPHEAFAYALEEIKKTIHREFEELRAEIRTHGAGGTNPQA